MQEDFLSYDKVKSELSKLLGEKKEDIHDTKQRREARYIEIDPEEEQRKGRLSQDETIIPIRVIDSNINREAPPYVRYLKQSRRLAIFTSIDKPTQNTEFLETEFTRGMSYPGFEIPLLQVRDGAALHGWDAVEVEYDLDAPFHVSISHIGRENLFLSPGILDIQDSEFVMRRYCITVSSLDELVEKNEFDEKQVETLKENLIKARSSRQEVFIYKVFIKVSGVIWVAWAALEEYSCDGWLQKPEKLFRGRRVLKNQEVEIEKEVPIQDAKGNINTKKIKEKETRQIWVDIEEENFPVFVLSYTLTENSKIADQKGRSFLDIEKQEAQTALYSSFVNAAVRASKTYGSPDISDGNVPRVLDTVLTPGKLYSQKINFWSPPFPDLALLHGASILDAKTQEDNGQIAYAVTARRDSRKTAREVEEASTKEIELASVSLVLYSLFLQKVFSDCWLIVQSRALQNVITFLPTDQFGDDQKPINDFATIGQRYYVKPSGDVDVIKRQEKQQRRRALWPIAAKTKLAIPFFIDMLRDELPEDAERYAQILLGGPDPKDNIIKALLEVIRGFPQDGLDEEQKKTLELITQNAEMSTQQVGIEADL